MESVEPAVELCDFLQTPVLQQRVYRRISAPGWLAVFSLPSVIATLLSEHEPSVFPCTEALGLAMARYWS